MHDDRVRITSESETVELEHATAYGRIIEGQQAKQSARVDVTGSHVFAKQLNVPVTVTLITLGASALAASVIFFVALTLLDQVHDVPLQANQPSP